MEGKDAVIVAIETCDAAADTIKDDANQGRVMNAALAAPAHGAQLKAQDGCWFSPGSMSY